MPWLVHLEFQSGYDPDLPLRLQRYNILVNYRHRLPVQSIALLLCPEADGPALTGLARAQAARWLSCTTSFATMW